MLVDPAHLWQTLPTNVLSHFTSISEQGNILWRQHFHDCSRNQGNSQRPCKSLLSGPSLLSALFTLWSGHNPVSAIAPCSWDSSHAPTISLVL